MPQMMQRWAREGDRGEVVGLSNHGSVAFLNLRLADGTVVGQPGDARMIYDAYQGLDGEEVVVSHNGESPAIMRAYEFDLLEDELAADARDGA